MAGGDGSGAGLGGDSQGQAVLAAGGSVGATADVVAGIAADMGRVKTLAQEQGFAVDATTGDKLIKAAETYLAKWKKLKGDVEQLKQGLPLGPDPYALQVTAFTAGQARDAMEKLDEFEVALKTYVEAIEVAKKNYAKMDDDAVQQFKTRDYV